MLVWCSEHVLLLAWLQSRWIHQQHRCWGCFWVSTKNKQKNPKTIKKKKNTIGPILQKKRHSSTTRGTEKERPELVNAPKPTARRQIWTHNHHANQQQHHISALDANGCTSLHVRGQNTRLFLPEKTNAWASTPARGLRLLLEKYWQCGDKNTSQQKRCILCSRP